MSYSQNTTPSTLHTPPTATSLASNFWTHQIQNCLYVLQLNHWFRPLLPFWSDAAVQPFPLSLLLIRHMHTQTLTLQPQSSGVSFSLLFWSSHLEQPPPRHQTLYYSLFLQKQTQDISFLWAYQLSNTVLRLNSVCIVFVCTHMYKCVCVCVCT